MAQIKEPKDKTITAKVTASVEKKIKAKSERVDRSVSYIINQALEKYFAKS